MKGKYKRNEFLMNVSKSRCRSTGVDESLSKLFALLICLTFDYNEVLCIIVHFTSTIKYSHEIFMGFTFYIFFELIVHFTSTINYSHEIFMGFTMAR